MPTPDNIPAFNDLSASVGLEGKSTIIPSGPEVIVDFVFDRGLFFISVISISDRPVYKASVQFDKRIFGVEGKKEISALPLFRNIEFLAPRKEITTFLDKSSSYFKRGGPTAITATISYQDVNGIIRTFVIKHNLEIYREIGYIKRLGIDK